MLVMPVYTVADACYTPITGITYRRRRHRLPSCKASERVLVGIVINDPLILQSLASLLLLYQSLIRQEERILGHHLHGLGL